VKSSSKQITLQLYSPHPGQVKVHKSKARFRVVPCGRRFGKTYLGCNEELAFSCNHPNTLSVWCAPTYRQTKIAYRLIKQAIAGLPTHTSDSELRIELPNAAVLSFVSSDNYDALRGNGIHFLVCDEFASIAENAWLEVLRPCLSDTRGRALLLGSPKGQNLFYRLYQRGCDPLYPDWESFTAPSSANPYIPSEEIEAAKRELPEDAFRQEYEAEFLADNAGVFRGIDGCISGVLEPPRTGHTYVLGWDPAKHQDLSVVCVLDVDTMHVVYFDRSNQIDYTIQLAHVDKVARLYFNAFILMDCTGVGDPLLEQLQRRLLNVEGYLFTNASKKVLIETLAIGIQNRSLTFPEIAVMIAELRMMEYTLTPSRMIQYSAPPGEHDDTVIALALCFYAAQRQGLETMDQDLVQAISGYVGY